jgi:amino acid transporter
VLAADELVAVTNAVKFRYDDGNTFLSWVVGEDIHPAVWISVFLILVTILNMFPVKVRIDLCLIDSNDGDGFLVSIHLF